MTEPPTPSEPAPSPMTLLPGGLAGVALLTEDIDGTARDNDSVLGDDGAAAAAERIRLASESSVPSLTSTPIFLPLSVGLYWASRLNACHAARDRVFEGSTCCGRLHSR